MVILVNTIYRIRESLQWNQEKMADEMNVTVVNVLGGIRVSILALCNR